MHPMTARSTRPESIILSRKRADTTPKPKTKRGANANGDIATARKYKDTSTNAVAESVDPSKPLTEKQKLFVKYWAEGDAITTASARAGYSDGATLAYRMVKMPNVLALYDQYKLAYEEAAQMTRKKVMDMMIESYDMAKLLAEPSTMVAAAREIGKMCGYYAPVETRVKLDVSGNVVHQRLNSLSDAELIKLITEGAKNEPA
jgi:phage terminase small subunit